MRQLRGAWVVIIIFSLLIMFAVETCQAETCKPTDPDMLGPFYKSDAPIRSAVGKGYIMTGMVKSSRDCSAIKGARIEFWLVNPEGTYDDEHRATVFSDAAGAYRFESNMPKPYFGRPPHIHIRVSSEGHETLVTQHYSEEGKTLSPFDLVLVPSR
jgi:protocatechuate 3,4-dioxygenase beta subunit